MKQSKRRNKVVALSIVTWLLSVIVICNLLGSEKSFYSYFALYLSALSLIITPLFVYMVCKRQVVYLYISHPSTEERLYKYMKNIVVQNGRFVKENYVVKELTNLKNIPRHTFFITIIGENVNSKQRFEIRTMVDSGKPIFVISENSGNIPLELQNYKLVRVSKDASEQRIIFG